MLTSTSTSDENDKVVHLDLGTFVPPGYVLQMLVAEQDPVANEI